MNNPSDSAPRRKRSWPRRLAYAAGTAALVSCVLLALGLPQRTALEVMARATLGARAEAHNVRIYDRLRAGSLRVFDPDAARSGAPPLVEISDLDADYQLSAYATRPIRSLDIARLNVVFDATNPNDTNYDFLFRASGAASSGAGSARFLPETIRVDEIACSAVTPTFGIACGGLRLEGSVASADRFSMGLGGGRVTADWWLLDQKLPQRRDDIVVEARFSRDGGAFSANPVRVAWPGLAEIDGQARVTTRGAVSYEAKLDTFRVSGFDLGFLDRKVLPIPVRFAQADFSGTHASGDLSRGVFAAPGSEVRAVIEGLIVGEPYREYYEGNLALDAAADEHEARIALRFGQGQLLSGVITGGAAEGKIRLTVQDWARGDLVALVPKTFRAQVMTLSPLQRISAAIDAAWKNQDFQIDGTLQPVFLTSADTVEPVAITIAARGTLGRAAAPFEQSICAEFRGQRAALTARLGAQGFWDAQLRLDGFEPGAWVRALAAEGALDVIQTALSGSAAIQPGPEPGTYFADLNLNASPLLYRGIGAPAAEAVSVSGKLLLDPRPHGRVEGEVLDVRVGEAMAWQLKNWRVARDDYAAIGEAAGRVNLERIASLTGNAGPWGELEAGFSFRNEKGVFSADARLRTESLGFGDAFVLYDVPVALTGQVRFDSLARQATGTDTTLTIGTGTDCRCGAWSFDPLLGAIEIPLDFRSDLAPLVAAGYLDAAEATLSGTGHVRRGEKGLDAGAEFRADAKELTLPGALATLHGASVSGKLAYAGTLGGGGTIAAEETLIGGASIRGMRGTWAGEGDALRSDDLEGALAGGTLSAHAEVGVLGPKTPAALRVTIAAVDLAPLLEELGVTKFSVTGIVGGDLHIGFDSGGFTELTADLSAPAGLALDRASVLGLIQSGGAAPDGSTWAKLGEKAKSRLIDRIVGREAQRSFERAELTLNCSGPSLEGAGQITLRSKDLNLTVDIPLHPGTLLRALELRQLEKVENFRTESVH